MDMLTLHTAKPVDNPELNSSRRNPTVRTAGFFFFFFLSQTD